MDSDDEENSREKDINTEQSQEEEAEEEEEEDNHPILQTMGLSKVRQYPGFAASHMLNIYRVWSQNRVL